MNPLMEQRRAGFARDAVKRIYDEYCAQDSADEKRAQAEAFMRQCAAFSGRVRTIGFGHAVAGLQEEDAGDPAKWLYKTLSIWLGQGDMPFADADDLLVALMERDEKCYMLAQIEALQFVEWLKTMSRGLLPPKPARQAADGAQLDDESASELEED